MNSLALQTKISVSRFKFLSSLAFLDSPSVKDDHNLTLCNPSHLLNEWSKSRKHSVTDIKCLHAHLLKTHHLHSNTFFANSLVDYYCKAASLSNAVNLFDRIPQRNAVSWNVMVSGYNENSLFDDSWRTFCTMHSLGYTPDQFTYGSVLSACSAVQSHLRGKQIYGLVVKNGFFSNGYVRAGTIDLFAKSYFFKDALRVFYDVLCDNVVCWNAVISGAVKNDEHRVALNIFCEMCRGFLSPNSFTFSSVLTACATLEELALGRGVQGWVIKCGTGEDVFVATAIIDMYAKCGDMDGARKEFSQMPIRNVVSWTAMISGFVKDGDSVSSLEFFKEMRNSRVEINNYTITSVIAACANRDMLIEAKQIHCFIFHIGLYSDSAVNAALINMYSKIGAVGFAKMVFREAENLTHLGTWAAIISACAQNESPRSATSLFHRMFKEGLRPDKFSTSSVLSIVDSLNLGSQIHCFTLKVGLAQEVSVGSSIFTMYSKCGSFEDSYSAFEETVERDNVSWASMIAGFAEHGYLNKAIHLFREMLSVEVDPDEMILTAVLAACSGLHSLRIGKEVHGYVVRRRDSRHIVTGSALVNMYSKCGELHLARRVFDMMPLRDQVTCSSLASGYARSGSIEEAIQLFYEMLLTGLEVDSFTLSSVLGAVALVNRPGIGIQLHSYIIKVGLDSEVSVGSSLVMMYSKCGSIEDCSRAFDCIQKPDLVSWTAMITSYALHGRGEDALRLYERMKESGIKPDSVTFVGVLSACSHNGLVEEGYYHLNSMVKDFGIEPGYRHYTCMVDLLGRSGKLKEAERFIKEMPIEPDALVWATLLASCKVHGDVELGRLAAKKVTDLEPCDAGAYVSFSNICADVGQWEEVVKIRSEMKGTGVNKEPGWSYL